MADTYPPHPLLPVILLNQRVLISPTSRYSEIILASKDYRQKCARLNKAGFCCNPSPQPGLAKGFNPTSSVSPSRRLPLPCDTHRVIIYAGPNELGVANIFPHIIRIFTLLRCRCTPNEYQHEHENHCNVNELFHRFLLYPAFYVYPVRKPGRLQRE